MHAAERRESCIPPPLQILLPWQSFALFWVLGLLACRWLWPAVLCALVLLWIDSRMWKPVPLVLTLGLWLLGWAVNTELLPQRPEGVPAWAHVERGAPPHRLEGVVDSVQGLPDGRLRVLLREVRPVGVPHAEPLPQAKSLPPAEPLPPAESLPGAQHAANTQDVQPLLHLVQWTWEQPDRIPLEGQRVRLSLPLRDTVGFRNEGLEDLGEFWRARKVLWRLWSRGTGEKAGQPEWLGEGDALAQDRHAQRQKLTEALFALNAETAPTPSAPVADARLSPPPQATSGHMTQAQAFLPALLFGDRQYLTQRTVDHMAAAALVHSLALSGQHLALAALLGTLLACGVGGLFPRLYLRIPRRKLMALCSLPPALLYVWLGGAPFSLLRAFIMLAVLALLLWRNHPRTLADALITALVAITVAQPLAVFDTGLQLSVLCVASMALVLPFLSRTARRWWPHPLPPRSNAVFSEQHSLHGLLPRLRSGISSAARALFLAGGVSLAIQWALAPLLLVRFGQVSPWFMLNIFWLPVLGLWVLPLAALGQMLLAVGLGSAAQAVLAAAAWPCAPLLQGLEHLSRLGWLDFPALLRPHWTALLGWAVLVAALALVPGRWQALRQGTSTFRPVIARLTVAACLLLAVGPLLRVYAALFSPPRLEMLDVGQGQALRLSLPGGQQLLIDGGGGLSPRFDPGEAIVLPRLTSNAPPRLHSVINSHPDADHWRGLRHILRFLSVQHFFHNGDAYSAEDAALLAQSRAWTQGQALHAGMVITLPSPAGDLCLEVLHPPVNSRFTDNNNSLVLRLTHKGRGLALLTGDAEIPALRHLLASGQDLSADVLILPHHGSRRSLLPEFYDAVAPKLALASCGRHNRFGFPNQQVQDALQERGIPLRTTSAEGGMTIEFQGEGKGPF